MSSTSLYAAGAGLVAMPLLVTTLFFASGAADPPPAGSVCTVTASPGSTSAPAAQDTGLMSTSSVTAEQLQNVRLVITAAKAQSLPADAAVVGLMTAEQESGLLNLANPAVPESMTYPHQGTGSNLDSVDLFQQRPSQGWGTVAQLMDPAYAASKFYAVLAQVPGWQQMAPWQAAQAVQRSADGTLYAAWQGTAQSLVTTLWADTGAELSCTNPVPAGDGHGDGNGGFVDSGGCDSWTQPVPLPNSCAAAVSTALALAGSSSGGWHGRCLNAVAQFYGLPHSGTQYAIDLYTQVIPATMRHDGNRNPPVGALLFWTTSNRAGHIALYVGNGQIVSTDITRDGYIDVVDATAIETRWHGTYQGWSLPYFPAAVR